MADIDGNTPVLEEAKMRELGFTDRTDTNWYYTARVGTYESINFTINKSTGDYSELVMDEMFGQPAYYGRMREPYRTEYRDAIDRIVEKLNSAGLTLTVDHCLYGFKDEEA